MKYLNYYSIIGTIFLFFSYKAFGLIENIYSIDFIFFIGALITGIYYLRIAINKATILNKGIEVEGQIIDYDYIPNKGELLIIEFKDIDGNIHTFKEYTIFGLAGLEEYGNQKIGKGIKINSKDFIKKYKVGIKIKYEEINPKNAYISENSRLFIIRDEENIISDNEIINNKNIEEEKINIVNSNNENNIISNKNISTNNKKYLNFKKDFIKITIYLILLIISVIIFYQINIFIKDKVNICTFCFGILMLGIWPILLLILLLLFIFNYFFIYYLAKILLNILYKGMTNKYLTNKIKTYIIIIMSIILLLIGIFILIVNFNDLGNIIRIINRGTEYVESYEINIISYLNIYFLSELFIISGLIGIIKQKKISMELN